MDGENRAIRSMNKMWKTPQTHNIQGFCRQ